MQNSNFSVNNADSNTNFINQIICGNNIEILKKIPDNYVDLIFADPPYFMQTNGELLRNNGEVFDGVKDEWDKFDSMQDYDDYCYLWLKECKRILKNNATIWVIGSFQNIYRIGYLMQNLEFWILNDIVWAKPNPVPNFRGTRFCNAHETLLWCSKNKNSKYTFNYKTMKSLNNDKQEKSVWNIGICIGKERIKGNDGRKVHSTQKPELLLEKIILSSSKVNDIILDPFFGTGTTGAVAKKLGRNFIGIEQNIDYVNISKKRIDNIQPELNNISLNELEVKPPKVSLLDLIKVGILQDNEKLFNKDKSFFCYLNGNNVNDGEDVLSIHKMAAKHLKRVNYNGWNYFYIERNSDLISIDSLRYKYSEIYQNNK